MTLLAFRHEQKLRRSAQRKAAALAALERERLRRDLTEEEREKLREAKVPLNFCTCLYNTLILHAFIRSLKLKKSATKKKHSN